MLLYLNIKYNKLKEQGGTFLKFIIYLYAVRAARRNIRRKKIADFKNICYRDFLVSKETARYIRL